MSIQERFKEPTDFDVAVYELGCELGFWPDHEPGDYEGFREHKGIVETNNPVCNELTNMLNNLVRMGALIRTEYSVRANPHFNPEEDAT